MFLYWLSAIFLCAVQIIKTLLSSHYKNSFLFIVYKYNHFIVFDSPYFKTFLMGKLSILINYFVK